MSSPHHHRRGPWSSQEDALLMQLVHTQGPLNWVRISHALKTRTPKQCRERYHQNLKPSLNHEPITPEEGAIIEHLVINMGKRWAEIARRLHNRSDNAVKNWWNGSMNRRERQSRRRGQSYEENELARYPPRPAPLGMPHYPSHSGYSSVTTLSPITTRFPPAQTGWANHAGLPSPSGTSPGADSTTDGAPSLVSDSSSYYSNSPRSAVFPTEAPIDLPPLRFGDDYPQRGYGLEHSPKLPPIIGRDGAVQLPRIRDIPEDRSQLLTAPNSPEAVSPKMKLAMSWGSDNESRSDQDKREKMNVHNLLS